MDQKHRNIIQKSFAYLIKNIHNVEDICDHLMSEEILTAGMVDSIKHKKPKPSGQTRELLTILPRRGKRAYLSFLNALKETENKEIADYLDEKENDGPSKPKVPNTEKLQESKYLLGDTKENVMQHTGEGGSNNKLNSQSKSVISWTNWPDLSKRMEVIQEKEIFKSSEDMVRRISENTKVYHMTGEKKGKVIFIANVPKCYTTTCKKQLDTNCDDSHCKTLEPDTEDMSQQSDGGNNELKEPPGIAQLRDRVDFDKTSLQQLFNHMKFNTKSHLLTGDTEENMIKFLKEEMEKDEGYDSLVVIFLSGGKDYSPAEIYDINRKKVDRGTIVDIIRESKGFKGKPKLVIITTYSFEDESNMTDSADVLDAQRIDNLLLPDPNKDDLFVVSSRPKEREGSWIKGKEMKGSYFVQAFVFVVKNYAHEKSLMEMMEIVNNCLKTAIVPKRDDDKTGEETDVAEVLIIEHSTDRKLHFFPGQMNIPFIPMITESSWPDLKNGTSLVKKKAIKKSTSQFYANLIITSQTTGKEFYPLTGTNKGKLLMVCNVSCPAKCCCEETTQKFKTDEEIEAEERRRNKCQNHVDFDQTNFSNLMKTVGFEWKAQNDQLKNKKREDVIEFLKRKIKEIDENSTASYDSLVLVLMSGKIDCESTKIYDADGEIIEKMDVLNILRESKHFKEKPKLVVIQTYNFAKEVHVEPSDQLDSVETRLQLNNVNSEDLFVVSSCIRDEQGPWMIGENMHGSYFIQAFIHIFKNHAHEKSFLELMEQVNSCLENAVVPELDKDGKTKNTPHKQVAEVLILEHCEKKLLYFFPFLTATEENLSASIKGKPVCQPSS